MVEKDDWRLQGQEKYLKGVTLKYKKYMPYNENWGHDHCEFCWDTFAMHEGEEIRHKG